MELNELIEHHTVRTISEKTNISEENILRLAKKDFSSLRRVKALGFISIIEREYQIDLSALKDEVIGFFEAYGDDAKMILTTEIVEQRSNTTKWFRWMAVLLLLGMVWYFLDRYGYRIDRIEGWLKNDSTKQMDEVPTPKTIGAFKGFMDV